MEWLKDAPTLAAIGKRIPFTVPSGYFENLSDTLRSMALMESLRFENEEEFTVPDGYFENLSLRIENRVSLESIRTIVPSSGFEVPDDYFSNLTARINSRLEKSSKVNTPVRKLFSSWISYAAAACVTVLIGTGLYFNSSNYQFGQRLSEVSDQEIINYLQVHSTAGDSPFIIENLNPDEFEQISSDVSSEELEQYINSTTL
ncbi:MAG: hypothetical protein ACYCZO_06780 [Daejeonella sp.]